MLGAGMDTRPWRLPLDSHLKWFELDRSDVLAAKRKALQEAGAGFEPHTSAQTAAGPQRNSSSGTNSSSKDSSNSSSSSGVQVPLRVGQWACASADLQKAGWVQKLQDVGLQPDQPTVSTAGLQRLTSNRTAGQQQQRDSTSLALDFCAGLGLCSICVLRSSAMWALQFPVEALSSVSHKLRLPGSHS